MCGKKRDNVHGDDGGFDAYLLEISFHLRTALKGQVTFDLAFLFASAIFRRDEVLLVLDVQKHVPP